MTPRRRVRAASKPAPAGRSARLPKSGIVRGWREDGVTLFKVAEISIAESRSNVALEKSARRRAQQIEAEVSYAYCLGQPASTAWWTDWGGFDLEIEITRAAVLARADVKALLARFEPKRNPYNAAGLEDFTEAVLGDYCNRLTVPEIQRGFAAWNAALPAAGRTCLAHDLEVWLDPKGA